MQDQHFKILVEYNSKHIIAEIESSCGAVEMMFTTKFPDGKTKTFFYNEDEDDEHVGDLDESHWSEENWGKSKLANDISAQIDKWFKNDYVEPFEIVVGERDLVVGQRNIIHLIYYDVYENGALLFTVTLNSEGNWVAVDETVDPVGLGIDHKFAEAVGIAIEDYQA